jgi:photosystem II stability/assembly factor-like uncharacterized protein
MAGGALLLADVAGRLATTADGGRSFRRLAHQQPVQVTGLADIGQHKLVLVGPRGATVAAFAAP